MVIDFNKQKSMQSYLPNLLACSDVRFSILYVVISSKYYGI